MVERFDATLDAALHDLAAEIAYPPTPNLRGPVLARLDQPPWQRWFPSAWPRALVLAAIAAVLLAATAAALAFVLPGLRIIFVPSLPAASVPADGLASRMALGERVTLEAVDVAIPAALGDPDEVYSSHAGEVITLVYAADEELPELADSGIGLLVQEIRGSLDPGQIEKLVIEVEARITPVKVGGSDGFWIEGPPHLVRYVGPSGQERAEETRLAGDTLVWERGGVLYRIESGLGPEETQHIAESIGR